MDGSQDGERIPFTAAALLEVLRWYNDVDWNSDDPAQQARKDAFLCDWAQMHADAGLPAPGFLTVVAAGAQRRKQSRG